MEPSLAWIPSRGCQHLVAGREFRCPAASGSVGALRGPAPPAAGAAFLCVAAGLAVAQRRRLRRGARTVARVYLDRFGRRHETLVSRIGPPVPEHPPEDLQERWQWGVGRLRVVCHDVHPIEVLAWHRETLVFGTSGGLVRAVDLESGSVVGDYYFGGKKPPSPLTAIHFDGTSVVAGDEEGGVHVWRAQLPGSWGFAHSPDCQHNHHDEAINGLAVIDDGRTLVSSDIGGCLVFWEPAGAADPKKVDLDVYVGAICAGKHVVFVGCDDGEVLQVDVTGQRTSLAIFPQTVSALAWDSSTDCLFVGLYDGSLAKLELMPAGTLSEVTGLSASEPISMPAFHTREVKSIRVSAPSESGTGVIRVLTAGADGRIGVWDSEALEPLWGLQRLAKHRQLCALGDHSRLVCNGLVIHELVNSEDVRGRGWSQNWQDTTLRTASEAPTCDAICCFDLLQDGTDARPKSWPSRIEVSCAS